MVMEALKNLIENTQFYKELLNAIESKERTIGIFGTVPGFYPFLTYNLSRSSHRPIIYVARDDLGTKRIASDLLSLGVKASYMETREVFFYKSDAGSLDKRQRRINTISNILNNEVEVLVLPFQCLFDKFTLKENFKELSFEINLDTVMEKEELINRLIKSGYSYSAQVEGKGQFAHRGGNVDIYTSEEFPYRIEFFGDEVDSIRIFDPKTQRSLENTDSVYITPAKEIIYKDEDIKSIKAKILKEIKSSKLKGESLDALKERFMPVVDSLTENGEIDNREFLLPFLDDKSSSTILNYFENEPLIIFEESEFSYNSYLETKRVTLENVQDLKERGLLLKSHDKVGLNELDVLEQVGKHTSITFNSLIKSQKILPPTHLINLHMRSITNFRGRIDIFKEEVDFLKNSGYKVVILGGTEDRSKRLVENLRRENVIASYLGVNSEIEKGSVYVAPGSLNEGFEIIEEKIALINFNEIFKEQKPKKKKKKPHNLNFEDLAIGDYVVHESYGVGRYAGTTKLTVQDVVKDFITIEYSGEDKLFLPIDSLSDIYKYIGQEGKAPKLNKLNSMEWKKSKAKVKASVREMAEDLIRLYSKRAASKGYSFSPDTPWQKDFEDAFFFEETEGQLEAIEDIKRDMESDMPMDRLLCADVGYGKTEVALRAAFKAVMDGKQVAFLCPTTILARQHYNTIVERFKDFPIEIVMLSRFRTKKEQEKDIVKLQTGVAEIVVGTHRILSKDVKFKDLGLLIVDEEQRFGVKDKEKLRMLKENVDTLTLTATPIPRTLQMSMVGIRDMSVIETPPEDRFPVQTYVLEYSDIFIRDAIIKELGRNGQVYYLFNRVAEMESKLAELKKLVPEARIEAANGQMDKKQLESTMERFFDGEIDVLLCSTIIETGMDVPSANTLIVTDANRLGLSQLYQLRGRIGRSHRMAYAYFTYEKNTSISEVSEKRLRAIREFTEFGSGYKIAMRDLEIRGSGNILGKAQHGHMDSIGYDLYVKYLKDAVKELKGEEISPPHEITTKIDLKVDSFIPDSYIEDSQIRMEIYKKIAILQKEEDYSDLVDELFDRFGDIPKSLSNLMDIVLIKNMATKAGILEIIERDGEISIYFAKDKLKLSLINELKTVYKDGIGFNLGIRPRLILKNYKYPLEDLKNIIGFV